MMKVTNSTFGMIADNRHKKSLAKMPKVQKLLKNGTWGKPFSVPYCQDKDPVAYMESLNPNSKFRACE